MEATLREDIAKYLPLSESTAYILLALSEPLHGYGVMQMVERISESTVKLGPGTLYGALTTLESEGLIKKVGEADRRKIYAMTDKGKQTLKEQLRRSAIFVENGKAARGWQV